MNWVQRKIYLYNVTFGLYMLDWWERALFNILLLVLIWFVCHNGAKYAVDIYHKFVPAKLHPSVAQLVLLKVKESKR